VTVTLDLPPAEEPASKAQALARAVRQIVGERLTFDQLAGNAQA
jgi:hypothetical protein